MIDSEEFLDRTFKLNLNDDSNSEPLFLKWGVMTPSYFDTWTIGIDEAVNQFNYKELAEDLDRIFRVLKADETFKNIRPRVVASTSIQFELTKAQQFAFKLKYCGEELFDE
jgi:hypothetical protein